MMASAPIRIPTMALDNNHITASQQWQLANLTRQKVSRETRVKEPNLRRLVGLCNTLDCYSSRLEELHSVRHIPGHHDSTMDDDSDDEQEIDADYGEGEVLEWFGDFGDEDAPIPATSASEGQVVDVGKPVDVTVKEVENESEDSASDEEDSDGSSWGDDEDEQYFSDSSVEDAGSEKD